LDKIIKQALDEDIGKGDITSGLLIKDDADARANIIAKEDFVLAGTLTAKWVFEIIDPNIKSSLFFKDGEKINTGDIIISIEGRLRTILAGERVALNFLQRLCGIATITNRFAEAVKEYGVKIVDTRKTTPNLRLLEKEAVAAGGGHNHRMGLYDGILIKDNHVKHCGGVAKAVAAAKKNRPSDMKIEIETKNLDEVKEAVSAGADIIMFDNMPPEMVKEALNIVGKKALTEVSGGVTLENIKEYAKAEPDFISIGALTHSAGAVDISLLIE
jgi:nicotinate-nucleotide pyrophosphorylase (carboxylating)